MSHRAQGRVYWCMLRPCSPWAAAASQRRRTRACGGFAYDISFPALALLEWLLAPLYQRRKAAPCTYMIAVSKLYCTVKLLSNHRLGDDGTTTKTPPPSPPPGRDW